MVDAILLALAGEGAVARAPAAAAWLEPWAALTSVCEVKLKFSLCIWFRLDNCNGAVSWLKLDDENAKLLKNDLLEEDAWDPAAGRLKEHEEAAAAAWSAMLLILLLLYHLKWSKRLLFLFFWFLFPLD